ncbi:MAG: LuxR C-terminal-related transcriptional regulator [Gemmatimonadaceae bacterium]
MPRVTRERGTLAGASTSSYCLLPKLTTTGNMERERAIRVDDATGLGNARAHDPSFSGQLRDEPIPSLSPRETRAPFAVLVATDVGLYAEGLALVLAADGRLRLSRVAMTAESAVLADAPEYDAVLLDASMPHARGVLHDLRARVPHLAIVLFGVPENADELIDFIGEGATAFVSRDATSRRLVETVLSALRGEALLSTRDAALVLRRLSERARHSAAMVDTAELTAREHQIAALLNEGLSNKEIASRLHICVATVKNHVHHILEKLQVQRRGQAASRIRGQMNQRM